MNGLILTTAILRTALGLIFLVAALSKLRDWSSLLQGIKDYQILPSWLARLYAVLLIPLELLVAALFLTGELVEVAIVVAAGLLGSFYVAVSLNLRRGRALNCHCFGRNTTEKISNRSLARIKLLLFATVLVGLGQYLSLNLSLPDISVQLYPQNGVLAEMLRLILGGFVVVVGAWLLALPDLKSLLRPRI